MGRFETDRRHCGSAACTAAPRDDQPSPMVSTAPPPLDWSDFPNETQWSGVASAMDLEASYSSPGTRLHVIGAGTPTSDATPSSAPPTGNNFEPHSLQVVTELVTVWFERYHAWFPILHQPSLMEALEVYTTPEACDRWLVINAIVATTVEHCHSRPSTPSQMIETQKNLKQAVILGALGRQSLRSMQALLIISIIEYGSGQLTSFWNLIAICKR